MTFQGNNLEAIDIPCLESGLELVKDLMLDGIWRSLFEIQKNINTHIPDSSISRYLRYLKEPSFGGYIVQKRRRVNTRLWEYRVSKADLNGNVLLF